MVLLIDPMPLLRYKIYLPNNTTKIGNGISVLWRRLNSLKTMVDQEHEAPAFKKKKAAYFNAVFFKLWVDE